MSILVTGANGFVGQSLCAHLLDHGFVVRAAIRNSLPFGFTWEGKGGETVPVGDLGRQTEWAEALRGVSMVVHLAARVHVMRDRAADPLEAFRQVNTAGTEALARQAAAAGVRRFIFLSSIKVNGERTEGFPFDEGSPPAPVDPYGISKWEAEQRLQAVCRQTGMEFVIIRPALVYGPGVKGNFRQLLGWVKRGFPLPLAGIDNRRSLIGLGNLLDLIVVALEHPAAAGETFLAADDAPLSTPQLIAAISRAFGKTPRLWKMPGGALKALGILSRKEAQMERLTGSLVVNNGKVKKVLGWSPPFSTDEEIAATVASFLAERR